MLLRCLGVLLLLHIVDLRFVTADNSLITLPERDTNAVLYFETALDSNDKLHLYWIVDYEEETVTFELRARVSDHDWIGVGFSDRGEITNADLCILWTDRKRKNRFQDVYTDESGFVTVDDHDDCHLLSMKRRGSITRYAWSRKFDTCDNQDYYIEDGTTHIVYAVGKGPIRRLDGINLAKEIHGFQRVQLLKNVMPNPPFPEDTKTITIHNNKVAVPNVETTYYCTLHLLPPEFENKNHIIQYSSAIQEGNEGLVHHMEVFHCEVEADKKLPPWNGPCTSPAKPKILEACKRVLAAWAMGALPFTYPEEAGLPIGGPEFSRYVMLEVHYNNPTLREGVIDSSGIKLTYTPSLREHDAGVMELGLEYTNKMAIPQHQADFKLTGYCVAECTRVLTEFERGRVIGLREGGFSFRDISERLGRNVSIVHDCWQQWSRVGTASRRPCSGRPCGITEREDRHVRYMVVAHRTVSAAKIRAAVGTTVTQRTVTNQLLQGQLRD
ncbi:Dopamine beta-hydroxylase [Araneus ventricosus]|uniref:Dopamine beta-hydroxylase n=1 Tax=Araneus ventricosus TaxID=182803 RepID=A0A4Y2AI58_ARAVE|nr:Dopamine beta-hydroxylase [Araneus ventricosus]